MNRRIIGPLIILFIASLVLCKAPAAVRSVPASVAPNLERETDPAVLEKLEWFQDLKLGLLIHWGTYSQWGIVESWSICSEDEPWCRRPEGVSYEDYKKKYEALKTTFNPVNFD